MIERKVSTLNLGVAICNLEPYISLFYEYSSGVEVVRSQCMGNVGFPSVRRPNNSSLEWAGCPVSEPSGS